MKAATTVNKFFGSKKNEFAEEALQVHNEYRSEHGVPPLILSKEMCKISQKWAEELAKRDCMSYSLNEKYGESVYCGWCEDDDKRATITARDCVSKWYSEIREYCFGKEPDVLTCGHFTQIVWKNSRELGIGHAISKTGKMYVVANYFPPGNYSGQFAKNVPPPGANQFKFRSEGKLVSSCAASSSHEERVSNYKMAKTFNDKNFDKEFLDTHNVYRKRHDVPPLILSNKLSKYAQEWANELAKKKKMVHRNQDEYGENIYTAWSNDPNFYVRGREPVDKWYAEIKDHKFGKEPSNTRTGHFTQIVWADTREVGVARATSKDGHIYVVANYFPAGNIVGEFIMQVKPPKS